MLKSVKFAAQLQLKMLTKQDVKKTAKWARFNIEQLGPLYIKLGQTLSCRQDLFPQEFTEELSELRENVTPMEFDVVEEIVKNEVGDRLVNVQKTPVAAASLGQCHLATIKKTGERVIIKVRRPNLTKLVEEHRTFIQFLFAMQPAQQVFVKDFFDNMLEEMDYENECKNMQYFSKKFKSEYMIKIPEVYPELSTKRLLTMEYVPSQSIFETDNPKQTVKALMDFFYKQFFKNGIFLTDPHIGNMGWLEDGRVVMYDYGLVCKLPQNTKTLLTECMGDILMKDIYSLTDKLFAMGIFQPQTSRVDAVQFCKTIMDYVDTMEISNADHVAASNNVVLHNTIILLFKTVSTLESICKTLNPKFQMTNEIKNHMDVDFSQVARSTMEKQMQIPGEMANLQYEFGNHKKWIKDQMMILVAVQTFLQILHHLLF